MSHHHGLEDLKGISAFEHKYHHHGELAENRFGRMFDLPPLYMDPKELNDLGAKEVDGNKGPMNGGTTSNPASYMTAADIFFGQFIDHDITLDVTSSLTATADTGDITNVRTPALDLDCIYGAGPEAHNYLYYDIKTAGASPYNQAKLVTAEDGTAVDQLPEFRARDLCRMPHGTAIIGDFRNDENRVISQLQLAMIRFHNNVVVALHQKDSTLKEKDLYEKAREIVTWHYQWVVITDFLVKLCGERVVANVLGKGRRFYCVGEHEAAYIPVEFSVAAYRFGHSMIPQTIEVESGATVNLFGPELGIGFRPLDNVDAFIDWTKLADTGAGSVHMAEKLDTQLAEILLELPFIEPKKNQSLASRNLLRGQIFLLPSGENVAKAMGRSRKEIKAVRQAAREKAAGISELNRGTPLWFYILMEAETIGRRKLDGTTEPGEGLGPVGARIVAETIIGLIDLDDRSFLSVNRNWRPTDEDAIGVSTLGEMLTYEPPPPPSS